MNDTFRFLFISFLIFIFFGNITVKPVYAEKTKTEEKAAPAILPVESSWVDSVFNELNMNERIGQLFMVAAYSNKGPEHTQAILGLIKKYHIGGLIFFQGTPEKQAKLTNIYQHNAKVPLMIAMDAEWGLGMRLDSTISYPRQMTLGAIQDDSLIYQMGRDIGEQLRRMGVHINFAPVVDVNNNPNNPVIGSRSFGEDKYNVARKGIAYMNGLQDNRVMAVAKHFPGHGDTDKDSHKTLPVINHDSLRLDSLELYPFKRLINTGVGGIMTAHLNIPSLVKETNRPSTLSRNVVTNLLRENLGFSGLVFTDALNMKGVTNHFSPGQIELEALKAGNDVLLYPQDVPTAINYIRKQVRRGSISEERINESCKRILAFKYWTGLDQYEQLHNQDQKIVSTRGLKQDLHKPAYKVLLRKLNEHAVTLLSNHSSFLPVGSLDTLAIASLTFGEEKDLSVFQERMEYYAHVDHFNAAKLGYDQVMNKLPEYDLVIAGILGTHESTYRNYGVKKEYFNFLNNLTTRTKVVLAHFGNPYALDYDIDYPAFSSLIVSYHDDTLMQDVTAQAIFGGIPLTGKLPVTINSKFPADSGEQIKEATRLKYTLPEEVGISSDKLRKVDSLVNVAIKDRATPGCQVLAVRNGKVFYQKSFGYHTYLQKNAVHWKDMYDLASITKVVAAVPALMRFYDQGLLFLDDTLGHFLPRLSKTNKGNLVVRDVLTHQAGLKPWIPFYQHTLETLYPEKPLISKNFSEEYPFKIGAHSYMAKNFKYKDSVFSYQQTEDFSIPLAQGMYMHHAYRDSVFHTIDKSELLPKNDYIYSDLGYYYFYQIIEKLSGNPMENFVKEKFYKPLGAFRMTFIPLQDMDRENIIPTENDMIFRKQLLQGYVHDPGTAMLGGVCGHAGVFSNANDLAKIMQMYLNGGIYGRKRFFTDSTLKMFTDSPFDEVNGNRRAIGFDKPVIEKDKPGPTYRGVSYDSFGHTGFTGTIAWADREKDLIYIFLSNRIHPDQDNRKLIKTDVRTEIQKAIYEAILENPDR